MTEEYGILCQQDTFVKSFCLEKDLSKPPWKCSVVAEPAVWTLGLLVPHTPPPETLWETQPHSRWQGRPLAGGGYGPVLLTWRKAVCAHNWDFAIGAASSLPCDGPCLWPVTDPLFSVQATLSFWVVPGLRGSWFCSYNQASCPVPGTKLA